MDKLNLIDIVLYIFIYMLLSNMVVGMSSFILVFLSSKIFYSIDVYSEIKASFSKAASYFQ